MEQEEKILTEMDGPSMDTILNALDLSDLEYLQTDIRRWAEETFGDTDFIAQALKLREEVVELLGVGDGTVIEELADCLIVILDLTELIGSSTRELIWEAIKKHCKNQRSEWRVKNVVQGRNIYGRIKQ